MWERPRCRDRRDTKVPPTLAEAPLLLRRFDILIYAEAITRVIFIFDRDQPLIIISVSFLHPIFSFISHQKVYIRSACRIGMQRIVITLRPRDDLFVVGWIGINADHHLRPLSVPVIPGSIVFANA